MSNIPQFLENSPIWQPSKGGRCYSRKHGYIDEPQIHLWRSKDGLMEYPNCGITFKPKKVTQTFCSDKCRRAVHKSVYLGVVEWLNTLTKKTKNE